MSENKPLPDFTVKKSMVEKYDICYKGEWGFFTIDESDGRGTFQAHTSYGDFAYSWGNYGKMSFKEYLIEVSKDPGYLLRKIAPNTQHFYYDETIESFARDIIRQRKAGNCTKEKARVVYDIVKEADYGSLDLFQNELYNNNEVMDFFVDSDYMFKLCVASNSPNEVAFAKEMFPVLAEVLKKEIEVNADAKVL